MVVILRHALHNILSDNTPGRPLHRAPYRTEKIANGLRTSAIKENPMLNRIKRAVANRRVGGAAVTTVALSFFLMGLIAASDLNWMGEAQAENTGAKTPNATAPRATPDS